MMRFVLLVAALCVYSPNCVAQQVDVSQQLRAFGHKMVEGTWHQKRPEDVVSRHTYKWALGNQYLLVYMWHQDKPNALAVTGIDPAKKLQTWWTFRDDGDIRITTVAVKTIAANKDKVALAGKNPVGSGSFEVIWKNSDTLEIIPLPGAKEEGKDAARESWSRSDEVDDLSWIDAKAPATIPKQLTLARHFSGRKYIDGTMPEGTTFVGAGQGKWILNGKFHIFTGSTANSEQTTWSHLVIMGIDPETKEAASWEFTSRGARSDITYDKSGMTIFGANIRSNGDKYSFKGHFTVEGGRLHYKSEIGQAGQTPQPYGWNYRDAQ